jgi:hypothetical protein
MMPESEGYAHGRIRHKPFDFDKGVDGHQSYLTFNVICRINCLNKHIGSAKYVKSFILIQFFNGPLQFQKL